QLTFRLLYAFQENFTLPLSHDEVVHEKGSLLAKMPGPDPERFGNLRALYGYMYAQPGKKLLFMGAEFGQWNEWHHDGSLDWHLLQFEPHAGLQRWLADLNRVYRAHGALHQVDFTPDGFEWVDCNDAESSVISLLRKPQTGAELVLVVCNFTPSARRGYRLGVPRGGFWRELLNSDAAQYGGSGQGNLGGFEAESVPMHGRPFSLNLTLPPLSALFFLSAG
ncbi:alpha amylase C-terminal domain-containing protein, partial [bacterium]|nr:alpha amylase C-terminal domain-containing protein [bacterium]